MVRLIRLAGWLLVALALAAAALEAGVLMAMEDWGALSALSLWDYSAPLSLREFRSGIRLGLGNGVWERLVQPSLTLPAWLLLGVPGALTVWLTWGKAAEADADRTVDPGNRPDPDAADIHLDAEELRAFVDSIPEAPEGRAEEDGRRVVVPLTQGRRDER